MIYFGPIEDCPDDIKEIWFAVRSLKPYTPILGITYMHVPELSPNLNLFFETQRQKKNCKFTQEWFDTVYAPIFIEQIRNDAQAQEKLAELHNATNDIYVACYCRRKSLCHTSLLEKIYNEK